MKDYIQQPVDVGYEQGIQQMGRGRRVSAAEWFEAIAHTMAMGLAMRGGVGAPSFSPAQREAVLRDIKNAMGRLLRGNASPREPDPKIVRQLTGLGQRTKPTLLGASDPVYQRGVPEPLPAELPYWDVTPAIEAAGQGVPSLRASPSGIVRPIMQIKSEAWGDTPSQVLLDLQSRGLWP